MEDHNVDWHPAAEAMGLTEDHFKDVDDNLKVDLGDGFHRDGTKRSKHFQLKESVVHPQSNFCSK